MTFASKRKHATFSCIDKLQRQKRFWLFFFSILFSESIYALRKKHYIDMASIEKHIFKELFIPMKPGMNFSVYVWNLKYCGKLSWRVKKKPLTQMRAINVIEYHEICSIYWKNIMSQTRWFSRVECNIMSTHQKIDAISAVWTNGWKKKYRCILRLSIKSRSSQYGILHFIQMNFCICTICKFGLHSMISCLNCCQKHFKLYHSQLMKERETAATTSRLSCSIRNASNAAACVCVCVYSVWLRAILAQLNIFVN